MVVLCDLVLFIERFIYCIEFKFFKMDLLIEEIIFRASSRVLMVFNEMDSLMELSLKSKISYPTMSHIIGNMKKLGIVRKVGRASYELTDKGKKIKDLMNKTSKELSVIVKTVHKDTDLRGGRDDRKTKRK